MAEVEAQSSLEVLQDSAGECFSMLFSLKTYVRGPVIVTKEVKVEEPKAPPAGDFQVEIKGRTV